MKTVPSGSVKIIGKFITDNRYWKMWLIKPISDCQPIISESLQFIMTIVIIVLAIIDIVCFRRLTIIEIVNYCAIIMTIAEIFNDILSFNNMFSVFYHCSWVGNNRNNPGIYIYIFIKIPISPIPISNIENVTLCISKHYFVHTGRCIYLYLLLFCYGTDPTPICKNITDIWFF